MRYYLALSLFVVACVCTPDTAYAYIGPGLAAGTIGVILGVIASVFLAIFGVVYYPIKRMMKKRKKQLASGVEAEAKAVEKEHSDS